MTTVGRSRLVVGLVLLEVARAFGCSDDATGEHTENGRAQEKSPHMDFLPCFFRTCDSDTRSGTARMHKASRQVEKRNKSTLDNFRATRERDFRLIGAKEFLK